MRRHGGGLDRWLFLLTIVLLHGQARAAIPGADDPKAYTYYQFQKERLEFGRRTLVQAYTSAGSRNPAWDEQAVQALDLLARYFANGSVEPLYKAEVPGHEEVLKAAEAAIAAGCDDPMVFYAQGAMLHDMKRLEAAKPILAKALELAKVSKYGPYRTGTMAARLATFFDPKRNPADRDRAAALKSTALELAEKAVTRPVAGKDQRQILLWVDDEFDQAPISAKQKFVAKIEADPQTDPWMLHVLKGKLHIRQGWDARGSGFAGTVTDQGWKVFREELAKAREHLTKAHELHPEYPEAASYMIEVAMGASERQGETREWLDKAARAQLDYYPAYNNYVWSIYPRWGGSHEMMFEFGRECADTGRYDTYVPYQLIRICERINNDRGKDFSVYRIPEVYRGVKQTFEEMERKAPKHLDRAWYQTYHMGIALRAGQYGEAAALLQKVGENARPDALALVGGSAPFVLSEVHAMTSKRAALLTEAEAAFAGGQNYPAAISGYQDALAAMEKDKEEGGQLFVRYRLKQLVIEKDYYDQKEVSLTPGEDFAPWYVQSGDWKREKDGTLVATTQEGGGGARLLCKADFGNDYELTAKVEWGDPNVSLASILVGVMDPYWSHAGLGRGGEVFMASGMESKRFPQEINQVNHMVVRVNGGRMSLKLNGNQVGEIRMRRWQSKDVKIGLGIPNDQPGWTVRFSDVKIKLLGAGGAAEEN